MRVVILTICASTLQVDSTAAQLASSPASPTYDIQAYCLKVANAVGGSYVIEQSCRDEERKAKAHAETRGAPIRAAEYCDQVAKAIGGSYMIYNSCLDQEIEAAANL